MMAASSVQKTVAPEALRLIRKTSRALRELKRVDPRDRYVLLMPAADRAYVGMGHKLLTVPAAKLVYEHASDIVKKDILKLCLEGPRSDLYSSMENMHLACFVTSHATLEKLRAEKPEIIERSKAAAGFGVGFVNALVFAGGMTFENGLELVLQQGIAMDRAAKVVPSAKVKVHVMPATRKRIVCNSAIEHCKRLGIPDEIAICSITKETHAHHIEIGGHEEAIKFLETEGLRLFKFRRIDRVRQAEQAFHTELMAPAREYTRVCITKKIQEDPNYLTEPQNFSLYSSTGGCRQRTVKAIKNDLINYPTKPILIEQLLHLIYRRPKEMPQPNTLVLWERNLLNNLSAVNRPAYLSARLYT